jgi:hypothetical protein
MRDKPMLDSIFAVSEAPGEKRHTDELVKAGAPGGPSRASRRRRGLPNSLRTLLLPADPVEQSTLQLRSFPALSAGRQRDNLLSPPITL